MVMADSHPRRVLVVDDYPDGAETLAEVIATMGCETAVASNGDEALRIAQEFRPHLALLDLEMPVMDGFELCRRLRAQNEVAALTLVAVSGFSSDSVQLAARAAGFAHYLVKPLSFEHLRRLLPSLIASAPR
jgi:CheY-like chemotaxis protein